MKKIKSVLISVFNKDGLEPIVRLLNKNGVTIYSTVYWKIYQRVRNWCCSCWRSNWIPIYFRWSCKNTSSKNFCGILNRRDTEQDQNEVREFEIPLIDLVIVDLYPFSETWKDKNSTHQDIIEKIDIVCFFNQSCC